MAMSQQAPEGNGADGCAELRSAVTARCGESHAATEGHAEATQHVRELKRDLVAAQHALTAAAEAADPARRAAEKAAARDVYDQSRHLAETDDEQAEATAAWARTLDRVNRAGRSAERAVSKAKAEISGLEAALHEAERGEQTARIRAEAAEAACLDARVGLAACEEEAQTLEHPGQASVFDPHAATGGHAVEVSEGGIGEPLVIESMISGDSRALELAAEQVVDHTGLSQAEVQLQLQELVDAIVSAASTDGFLVFDDSHPFWAHLSFEEARDVVAALARLGFRFEPTEGWHAGRAPTPADLSMALAYAGLDARNMRDLPSSDDLRVLPQSIGVDARAFLAAQAPDLAVDHLARVLGRRADQLEALWNEWGQIRPILLSERRSLGSLPG